MPPPNGSRHQAGWWARLFLPALLAGLVLIEIYGFWTGGLFSQEIWDAQGRTRLIQFAGVFASVSAAVLAIVPWLAPWLAALGLAAVTLILLPKAVLAMGFFGLSAWCLGSLVRRGRGTAECLVLGLALYIIPMPVVARLPVNYPAVWMVVLAIPIVLRRPRLRRPDWSGLPSWGERLGFALLVFVFTIHWFAMLKPEAGADGLAMHLAVPEDIARHHLLTFAPERFVWAVMPMGGDFVYAIVYQFGGEHAARLLNLGALGLLLALLHGAVRKWTGPGSAWLMLALFAASPLSLLVTGELFIENILASLLLGAFLAVGDGALAVASLLAGAALATKIGALPLVILLVAYAAWTRPARRTAVVSFALLVAAAAPTYAVAWAKTGNPLFPFLNERFHSPLLPANAEIHDDRFHQPLTWHTPYDLTFRSNLYFEGQNGSFGFQHLVFAGLALAAIFLLRKGEVTAAALLSLAASLAILNSDPNARYLYPELALLAIPVAALSRTRGVLAFAVMATLLNTWFMGAASYWHKDLYGPFTDGQRQEYLGITAPIRVVYQWFEQAHPGAPVLLTHDTAIAGLSGPVYENQWHQYNTMVAIRRAPDVRALLQGWGVQYVIERTTGLERQIRQPALRELVRQCGTPEFTFSEFSVVRLEPSCEPAKTALPGIVAGPGRYDDFAPAVEYVGEWEHNRNFAEAFDHTISYSDERGAEIRFVFEGTQLDWMGARAPNRGIAQVAIDSAVKGEFDLYAPEAVWQQRLTFDGLSAGRHVLTIRVTGRGRRESQGNFVDVDALEVK